VKPENRIPPDDLLLCESCGYELSALRRRDKCPECGRPIGSSLPERRNAYGSRGLLERWWLAIASPIRIWERVDVSDFRQSRRSLQLTLLVVSLVPGVSLWLASGGAVRFPVVLPLIVPAYIVFGFMTFLEEVGIRFFGRRRGWRISKNVSAAVVSHASIAWALSGVGVGVVWALFLRDELEVRNVYGPISSYTLYMFLAFLPGMLWFETLVWIGMRKLRFANVSGAEKHLADAHTHGLEPHAAGHVGDGASGRAVADPDHER